MPVEKPPQSDLLLTVKRIPQIVALGRQQLTLIQGDSETIIFEQMNVDGNEVGGEEALTRQCQPEPSLSFSFLVGGGLCYCSIAIGLTILILWPHPACSRVLLDQGYDVNWLEINP